MSRCKDPHLPTEPESFRDGPSHFRGFADSLWCKTATDDQEQFTNMFRSLSSQSRISYSVKFIQHPPKKQHIASQPCVVLFITFKIPVRLFKKVQKTTIKIVWAARAARSAIMIPNYCSDIPNLQLRLSRKGGEDASSNGKTHTGASISEQLISPRLEAHASCCLQPLFIKGSSSRKQTKSEGVKAEGRRS